MMEKTKASLKKRKKARETFPSKTRISPPQQRRKEKNRLPNIVILKHQQIDCTFRRHVTRKYCQIQKLTGLITATINLPQTKRRTESHAIKIESLNAREINISYHRNTCLYFY